MTDLAQLLLEIQRLSPESQRKLSDYVSFLHWQESLATQVPAVMWSYSFIEMFHQATIATSQEAKGMHVQMDLAQVGGETRPALWAHPPVVGQAVLEYHVAIPKTLQQVSLRVAVGIRDGSRIAPNNLVAFSVRVNGMRVWGKQTNNLHWQEIEIPLNLPVGDVSRVEFATEALGSHQWTWAVWGEPELIGWVSEG
jgi:hypothetical protein